MFSSTSTLINNSGHDHQDTESQDQTLMLRQEYHSSPFLFFHHDPFLDQENDFLATHDHQDPHQFLPQNQHHRQQQQQQQEILLGSCNGNNGGDQGSQEVINPAAERSSSSKGGRTSSNSNNKKRSISDHGDRAKQPSQRRRSGKKDRHSKIYTAQGPRDRRMRLSLQIARKFFDLQDILGFDKASKTIEWLFTKSKAAIKELTDSVPGIKRTTISCSNGGKSITTVLSCTSESEVASSSAIKLPGKSTRSPNNHKDKISKGKKRLRKLPVFNPDGRDKARARARERTKEKMKNMVKGCSSPPNPSCRNLEKEIMPATGGGGGDEGGELQEGKCSSDLLQQEIDSVNLTDHRSKSNLGDAVTSNNSSFLDFSQHQHDFEEEEEYFSWYPLNLESMISTTPQAAGNNIVHHVQYPFASFINASPFSQQQRTSSLNLATTSSIDQGQNMVSTTTTIFATQESENPSSSVTLNFSNLSHDHHHQININTDSGNLKSQLLDSYHLSCNPSYKFGSLF